MEHKLQCLSNAVLRPDDFGKLLLDSEVSSPLLCWLEFQMKERENILLFAGKRSNCLMGEEALSSCFQEIDTKVIGVLEVQ